MSDVLKAPFPYFGGKSTVADEVWRRFGTDVRNYIEPFAGSAAMLLGRPRPFGGVETINDKDGMVANFWRALQHDPEQTAHWLDWPVNECVPEGTMIATPEGDIPIEQVRPGMIVLGEHNGAVIKSTVVAARQGESTEMYQVGDLMLTGNHPVWTRGQGYVKAESLASGMQIAVLDWPFDKIGLVMLSCDYGDNREANLADLYVERPANTTGALCGNNLSWKAPLQRAPFARDDRGEDAPRLLDTVIGVGGDSPRVPGDRNRPGRRVARRRARVDSQVSAISRFGQPYRWWRRNARGASNNRNAPQIIGNAQGCAIQARASICDEGQTSYCRDQRKDTSDQYGADYARKPGAENLAGAQRQAVISCPKRKAADCSSWEKDERQPEKENPRVYQDAETSPVRRNWHRVCLRKGCYASVQCPTCVRLSGDSQGVPLQRVPLPVPIVTYNLQTSSSNYFANRILVHNCDLTARHIWLVNRKEDLQIKLEGDPDFYDAKIAGWWCWGMCCWIGSGWCSGNGPWQSVAGQRIHLGNAGQGVNRQRIHLGDAGQGVNRQRIHLGDAGQGVNRQLVHLGTAGRGVNRQREGETCAERTAHLVAYMQRLADRLRYVRVCCGDWSRVCGSETTLKTFSPTAVFLDPPYAHSERAGGLYAVEMEVATEVREWAIAHGDDPAVRIALCGYDGEHVMPDGWTEYAWKAAGGYGGQAQTEKAGRGKENCHRERVWFSPHCLSLDKPQPRMF